MDSDLQVARLQAYISYIPCKTQRQGQEGEIEIEIEICRKEIV